LFSEEVESDFISRTKIQFSRFRLTTLVVCWLTGDQFSTDESGIPGDGGAFVVSHRYPSIPGQHRGVSLQVVRGRFVCHSKPCSATSAAYVEADTASPRFSSQHYIKISIILNTCQSNQFSLIWWEISTTTATDTRVVYSMLLGEQTDMKFKLSNFK